MKALILAAGEAKRLRPITKNKPKCLLEVGGKSIIDYQIENLMRVGITEAVVVIGFMADMMKKHLSETHPHFTFHFIISKDYKRTYPAHGLWLARKYLRDTVLYLNADVICHPEIIRKIVFDRHHSVTALQRTPWDEEEVNIILKKDSAEIVGMGKHISKNLNSGEFIGVTKIGKKFGKELVGVLDSFIKKEEYKKFAADALNLTVQRGEKMYACDVTDFPAIEVDTREDLKQAEEEVTDIKKTHDDF